jgi:hypothetical protein
VTTARFESSCPLCGFDIQQGQSLMQDMDSDQWAHAGCVEARVRRDEAATVCPDCFILKPCGCDS